MNKEAHEPVSPTHDLRKALEGIADDYMTSEQHHPGYVLIPITKFEQLRTASEALSVSTPTAEGEVERLAWVIISNLRTDMREADVRKKLKKEAESFGVCWHQSLDTARRQAKAVLATLALPPQGVERDGVHARAWVAAEYRVTSSPHEHTASDSLAMARYILSGKPPAGQSLKPCPEEAKEELCSFPACNCAKERLPAALTSASL